MVCRKKITCTIYNRKFIVERDFDYLSDLKQKYASFFKKAVSVSADKES